ncbi:Membrane insertase OXA1/ALB3/YidC [Macleaya cordata]|uniref:Membrane insertase OXA1/ALB3/YidC n=1 Tax=Macleaya cordata TaxID=56857 RepID=A0A200R4H5_MACCD|nr:Membrane insertase OXA1/ALB3/YidC [Macleaya cordata]
MSTFMSFRPHPLLLPPISDRSRASSNHLLQHRSYFAFSNNKPFVRGSVGVVRFGFKPPSPFLDSDGTDGLIQHLFGRVEGLLYTLADAAVTASDSVNASKQNGDWLSGITNLMESVLKVLNDGISTLHVPYAYGFAIILLTVIVKAATFPLTKKQVESAMSMRSLQPQVKAIQQRYAGDPEKIQLETARLYKLAGVNPLAGRCLPTLATIPVWIGLYRALSNVADEGLLTEGFFWIPSLAGPTTIAARQNGSGISWLFPFVDGHPPLGWSDTLAYLVLPVLLVVSQYISVQIMQSSQGNDPNLKSSQVLTKFLPLMIGYFALSVPSGLSLYWFTNNILSTTQQIWLQKLGGAKNTVIQFSEDTIKEEQQKIQKSVVEVNSTKPVESRQGDNLNAEGLRPGDRFKQLKEQEARRRQQKEEEKKKLQEAVNGTGITNEEHNKELKLVLTKEEINEAKLVDAGYERLQTVTVMHDSSKTGVLHVNGDNSTQDSNNDQENVPSPRTENGLAGNIGVDGKDEQQSSDNLEKEEFEMYSSRTTIVDIVSEKDGEHDRTEQSSRSDEA